MIFEVSQNLIQIALGIKKTSLFLANTRRGNYERDTKVEQSTTLLVKNAEKEFGKGNIVWHGEVTLYAYVKTRVLRLLEKSREEPLLDVTIN